MTTLLYMTASLCDDRSHSQRGTKWVIAQSAEAVGGLCVIERDLAAMPLSHPDAGFAEASLTPDAGRTVTHRAAFVLSETLISELEAADVVLISMPVHNYTVFSALKAWIDLVVWPERTFRRTPTGKVGMLTDRSVLMVSASGGDSDGAHAQIGFLIPHLRYVFATAGTHRMEGIHLQNTARGVDSAIQAFESFRQELVARMPLMPLTA